MDPGTESAEGNQRPPGRRRRPSRGEPPGRRAATIVAGGPVGGLVDFKNDRPGGRIVRVHPECEPWRRSRCIPPPEEERERASWRREWDSNPRRVAPHTLSKRADSAALASLPGGGDRTCTLRSGSPAAWTGPARRDPVNRVRSGRKQLSAASSHGAGAENDRAAITRGRRRAASISCYGECRRGKC